jgi:hypothetical protein
VRRLPFAARLGAIFVALAALAAAAKPLLYTHDPYGQDFMALSAPPSASI